MPRATLTRHEERCLYRSPVSSIKESPWQLVYTAGLKALCAPIAELIGHRADQQPANTDDIALVRLLTNIRSSAMGDIGGGRLTARRPQGRCANEDAGHVHPHMTEQTPQYADKR